MWFGLWCQLRSWRCCCRRFSAENCVDAPATGAVKDNEQEKPAIKDGEFALVRNWEEAAWRVDHEIGHRHRAARDECSEPRKQAKGNQKSADETNPTAKLKQRCIGARHPAKHAEE